MTADKDITPEQLEMLKAVFRAEAHEHLNALGELLLALEQQPGAETGDVLQRAFREAHSLKGSAGTIGFDRVARIMHRLEDVLGAMRRGERTPTPEVFDSLLSSLDVIREAIDRSEPGDDRLTSEETAVLLKFEGLLAGGAPAAGSPAGAAASASEGEGSSRAAASGEGATDLARGGILRIPESKLDSVIDQVGELFEARLHMESLYKDLKDIEVGVADVAALASTVQRAVSDSDLEGAVSAVVEKAGTVLASLHALQKALDQGDRHVAKLIQGTQNELTRIRLAPVSTLYPLIKRQVRDIARHTGKKVRLDLGSGEHAIDRKVLDAVEEPIIHIIRNAIDHGIELPQDRIRSGKTAEGTLRVATHHTGDAVELSISDDGRGIDPLEIREALKRKRGFSDADLDELADEQMIDFLFESGFSTHGEVSQISGRGVGLDIVKFTMERLGGEVRIESRPGSGTTLTLRLPLVLSTVRCLLVKTSGRIMAIPAANVDRVMILGPDQIQNIAGGEVVMYEGQHMSVRHLGEALGLTGSGHRRDPEIGKIVAITRFGERRVGFVVDEIIEYAQLVLKALGDLLERVPGVSGISVLGTGDLALVLNPADLVRTVTLAPRTVTTKPDAVEDREVATAPTILVVDDSIATRTLEKTLLETAGYNVVAATDGLKALEVLASRKCDLVITDVQMPNMDGFELTRTIKSRPATAHMPVIIVTSLGTDNDKMRGLDAGADAYLVKKKLTQRELVETISMLL